MILVNTGNYCYIEKLALDANTCSGRSKHGWSNVCFVQDAFEGLTIRQILRSLLPAQVLFGGWSNPEIQHDVSEYLQHVFTKVQPRLFQGRWLARRNSEYGTEITDEGSTCCPIPLPLPGDGGMLQDAIDECHNQAAFYALQAAPTCLVLQMGRFLNTNAGLCKQRHRVSLDATNFHVRVFADEKLATTQQEYAVSSIIFHLGQRVNTGHYRKSAFSSAYALLAGH